MEPKKHYFAHIPTIAIFLAFALSVPLGILLLILKSIDKDSEKKELGQSAYTADFRAQDTRPDPSAPRNPETTYGHDTPTEEQKKAKQNHKSLTTLCTIGGALFLFVGCHSLFIDGSANIAEVIRCLAQIVGGGAALLTGLRMDRTHKLERLLDKIVGDQDNIPLDELFAAAGVDAAKGRAAVESAIDHGYFGADAYIDNRTNTLVVRGAAPQPPQPRPEPKAAPRAAAPEDEYTRLLRQLREVNDAIPDPVMTSKIDRLEQLSARIFALAQQDPGKKAQLQKFMDYYLPTSLKLLHTYASLSAQDVQGQNITEAKQSIERSMDLLVTAFENQLDKLFQSDALDVTADIAALKGMLNLDGLTESDFPQK